MLSTYFSDRARNLCLVFWLLALIPAIPVLNPTAGLALLPLALYLPMQRKPILRWGIMLVVLAAAIASIFLKGAPWLSASNVLTVLSLLLILKWAEARSLREFRLVALATVILAAQSSLYLSGLMALAYLLLCGLLLLLSLMVIADSERRLSLSRLTAKVLGLCALALPVTALLFVTVPRIQGPMWDIGLAIGLPIELAIDQDARDIGLKASLRAGQVSRVKRSDAPVLVAEFKGAVPYKSRMYWRGPVFSDYDGESWTLADGWNNRSQLLRGALRGKGAVEKLLTEKRDRVQYEARVSAHGERWLYALDLPSGRTPEAFISADFQLLAIRRVEREFQYYMNGWLEYQGGKTPDAQQRARYLAYPDNSNPRLKAYGEQLAQTYNRADDVIYEWRKQLATGGYQFSETTDISSHRDNLDYFFFDTKVGTIEHLAGSTALVLRAAGIPTRLVSGYRGGSLIALTNFVVVKQEHAHVWVEAWLDGSGWQRIDAKDFVAPPAPEHQQAAAAQGAPKKAEEATQNATNPDASPAAESSSAKAPKPKPKPSSERKEEPDSGWLRSLNVGLESWILNYNPERQVELMKKSGLRKVDWKSLVALALLGLLVLAIIYGLLLQLGKRRQDPVSHSFNQLNTKLAKMQLACGEQECPSQWLRRLAQQDLPFYPALHQIVGQYLGLRYAAKACDTTQIKTFQRDVKRLIAML